MEPLVFNREYRAYSGAFIGKPQVDDGGKIILPESAMDELSRMKIVYPMMFEITSKKEISTHCGVLEFSATEGHVYIPYWMMQHLRIKPGDFVRVKNVTLKKGKFVKLRPQTKDFTEDIENPKVVLEAKFRNFSALTRGDTVMISYCDKHYCIDVVECRSRSGDEKAISVVDTDLEVDFDRPADMPPSPRPRPGSVSPALSPCLPPSALVFSNDHLGSVDTTKAAKPPPQSQAPLQPQPQEPAFKPFQGAGYVLKSSTTVTSNASGSKSSSSVLSSSSNSSSSSSSKPSAPPANLGQTLGRTLGGGRTLGAGSGGGGGGASGGATSTQPSTTTSTPSTSTGFVPFSGTGRSLK